MDRKDYLCENDRMNNNNELAQSERRAAFSLASIFAFRMLGLFMILPVFSLYAGNLSGATPSLIGLAMGIYGLTQACLQIPFGMLSDRWGRKPVIAMGMVIFAVGSVIAATAHGIEGIIIGRAIQGAGAVGSTIIALIADLTREEFRTKAMAIVGMTIGLSFTAAMVLGPILNTWVGVPGIFWLTSALALIGILILYTSVPNPQRSVFHRDAQPVPQLFKRMLTNLELLRLDFGILSLHAILTACFVVIPITLERSAGVPEQHQWYLYLPVLVLSFACMVPFIIIAEKRRCMKQVFIGAILTLALAQLGLWELYHSEWGTMLCLFVFFTAFTLLEASLPSLISKVAPAGGKGTAMGIYSSSQFFGIFLGGSLGGWLFGHHHPSSVFLICALIGVIWLIVAISMKAPPHLATHMINVGQVDATRAQEIEAQLLKINGVADAIVVASEGVAYLKVDNIVVDKKSFEPFSVTTASA